MNSLKDWLFADWKYNRTTKELGFRFFVVTTIFIYLYLFYKLAIESQDDFISWTISDWLINYDDGGFKRRGLMGSLLFWIQDKTGVSLQKQVLVIQLVSYGLLVIILLKQLVKKDFNLIHLSLLLSPFILFFPVSTIPNAGRKEIMLLLLISSYAFLRKSIVYDWGCLFLFVVLIFFHELVFFYLPFLFWLQYIKNGRKIDVTYIAVGLTVSVLVMGTIYFYGGAINQGKSLSILSERGIHMQPSNIFQQEKTYDFHHVLKYKFSFFIHILEFSVILFQLYYCVWKFEKIKIKEYIVYGLICFFWVAPLFYLGIDWFRWIYIFASLFALIIICNLKERRTANDFQQRSSIVMLLITPVMIILFYLHMNHDEVWSYLSSKI